MIIGTHPSHSRKDRRRCGRTRPAAAAVVCAGLCLLVLLVMPCRVRAGEEQPADSAAAAPLDELRSTVEHLERRAADLERQNEGLRNLIKGLQESDIYIVVDTENNRLTLRQGHRILLSAVVGTGSRKYVQEETGRNWYFESPLGSLTVLAKERNPVWIRPDWSYVEENMPIPDIHDPDRVVRDVLGKYALVLGNGYKIHGTTFTDLLGTHFTHGCIAVGDRDLEVLFRKVAIGTKVYIY